MLAVVRKECLTFKNQCETLIPQNEDNQTTLIHCRIRAEKICESLDHLTNSESDLSSISLEEKVDILKAFIFVVLDFTFYNENNLAEDNFVSPDARSSMQEVLHALEKPRMLYNQYILNSHEPTETSTVSSFDDAIGDDLAECLYWRKGALIYMFHSAIESQLLLEPKPELERLLTEGVENLKMMLSVRQEFKVIDNDAFVHDDGNTLRLIQRGLFSDTHVLALMYAGEMCFWLHKWVRRCESNPGNDSASASSNEDESPQSLKFDARSIGVELLTRYREAVNGPLKSAGWSADKAEEILRFFQS